MGGRACQIIINAVQLPTTSPASASGRQKAQNTVRKLYRNPTIARQSETATNFDDINTILSEDEWSSTQLQTMLDSLHALPSTE